MVNGFPWGGTQFPQIEWRAGVGESLGEGVIADRIGSAIVTAAGTDTEVDIRAHRALVQGVEDDFTATSIDVATFGSNPSSGQTRIDRICWKYDPTAKTLTLTCVPGTPATTGSAVAPSLSRSTTGAWYVSIARVTRIGTAAVLANGVVREHAWLGPYLGSYASSTALPGDAPQGSTAWVATHLYQRLWNGSSLAWSDMMAEPAWSGLGASVTATGNAEYRQINGGVQFRGTMTCLSFPGGTIQNFPTGAFTTIGTYASSPLPAVDRQVGGVRFLTSSYGGGMLEMGGSGVIKVRPEAGATTQTVSLDGLWVAI